MKRELGFEPPNPTTPYGAVSLQRQGPTALALPVVPDLSRGLGQVTAPLWVSAVPSLRGSCTSAGRRQTAGLGSMDGPEGASGTTWSHSVLLQMWSLEPRPEQTLSRITHIWDGARARGGRWWPSLLLSPLDPPQLAAVAPLSWLQAPYFLPLPLLPLLLGPAR